MRAASFARAVWRNRRRLDGAPRFLTYTVTFACNAKCIMCDSWKKPSPGDLTLGEVADIFGQLPTMDAVRLTGGEPFVRNDLVDIAHLAHDRLNPLVLHVTTNGFLTDRIVKFCEQRPREQRLVVLVSIDGMADKHNHVRGRSTAWDSATKTLRALAPRQKELGLVLAANQTIVDAEGLEHYRLLREFLRPLGVRHNMVLAYDASATYDVKDEVDAAPREIGQFATFGDFSPETLEALLREVERDLGGLPLADRLAKRYYLRGIRNRVLGGIGAPNPPCAALNTHLRLFPNGDVPTCQFNTKKVGNLRRQSFADVWYGDNETMRAQRDWVRKCPGCWAECEVLPSAIYTGDLLVDLARPRKSIAPRPAPETIAAG